MKYKALVFRYLPTVLLATAFLAVLGIVGMKLAAEKERQAEDAILTQWNETERLALGWSESISALSAAFADTSESRVSVNVGSTRLAIRYVDGQGQGVQVWENLVPGTAIVLRTGVAGRFEGRLSAGGYLQAKDLGLKSFPTPGEGIVFMRRPEDGVVFALAPRYEGIVIAALPPLVFPALLGLKSSDVPFALVTVPGPWMSQAASRRMPLVNGQVVHTSDTVGFGQQTFAQANARSLLEGPTRFELRERRGALSFRLAGMGTAPITGTNLRLVTRWQDQSLPSRIVEPVVLDLSLVCLAGLILAGLSLVERSRFLTASKGLQEAVRAILFQRETPEASEWSVAPFVKDFYRDVLGNVNRVTMAHRALHSWGEAWSSGFAHEKAGMVPFFLPAKDCAAQLGFDINVKHDTEWEIFLAASPAMDGVLLLVLRRVDFRTDLLRLFLSRSLESTLNPSKKHNNETTRDNVISWLQAATDGLREEDPLTWGVYVWTASRSSKGAHWALLGHNGHAGFSLASETEPWRMQWGEELIAELVAGTPPAVLPQHSTTQTNAASSQEGTSTATAAETETVKSPNDGLGSAS